jgi:hypothetical protein
VICQVILPLLASLATLALLLASLSGADARDKRHRIATYEPRIICGQTGCFEIPRGCSGELRRTGRSVVAVMWCDRK